VCRVPLPLPSRKVPERPCTSAHSGGTVRTSACVPEELAEERGYERGGEEIRFDARCTAHPTSTSRIIGSPTPVKVPEAPTTVNREPRLAYLAQNPGYVEQRVFELAGVLDVAGPAHGSEGGAGFPGARQAQSSHG
jgi:hypothetical protein